MINKYILLVITSVFLATVSYAQRIEGRVMDEMDLGLPSATVVLLSAADSSMINGATTDDQGYFQLTTSPGNYYLVVSFVGYDEEVIGDIRVERSVVQLGIIAMKPSSLSLSEVEVVEKKEQMELKLDKRVYNVQQDLSNIGSNAAEILDNIPSITVDVEGNISLRGSGNVRILINGKPSGLVSAGDMESLRQLMGDQIERIEVITNPSARYDAEGEVGIINIVLKEEKRKGVNGSFELTAGVPDNYRAGFNLNYRRQKINFFAGASAACSKFPGGGTSYQSFFNSDTTYAFEREQYRERGGVGGNFRTGADIYINEKNTLSVSGLVSLSDDKNTVDLDYRDFNDENILTQTVDRFQDEQEDELTLEGSIQYRRTFDQEGKEWTIDFKYIDDDDTELAEISEFSSLGDTLYQRSSNTEDQRNILIQSDFIVPVGEDGKFETGFRNTFRRIDNVFLVEEIDFDGQFEALPGFDNDFTFLENIYAGYVMFGNETGPWGYQLGLRLEYSDITTELINTNEVNRRDYLNLFPSAHFTYKIKKNNTLQLSYSRRLSRPGFRSLLPFSNFSDNRNLRLGNPDLDPEFTHSLEAGYLYYFNRGSLLGSAYYRYRTGVIERITTVDSDGISYRIPVNLAVENAYGIEFNMSYDINEWWNLNTNFNFYRAITEGQYLDQELYRDALTWNNRTTSKLTLFKEVDIQLSLDYQAPEQTTQGRRRAITVLDFGATKDIWNKRATITVSVRDMFNSRRWRSETFGEDFFFETDFQWRARQFLITFNYRLNQDKRRGGEKPSYTGMDDM
jgi:outer membrane receptor protein involved in Fe transport